MESELTRNLFILGWYGQVFKFLLVLIPGWALGAVRSEALEYYVCPSGSDTNPGTIGAPFKTIAKARDVVRTVNAGMTGDIIVYLRGGWHTQTAPILFDQQDSGNNGHNIIYQAYPGERPVISGGRRITGWTVHDAGKGIWKANAPGLETRQLYVDCVRAVRAHKGTTSGSALPGAVRTATGFTTTDAALQQWINKSDIEFVFNGLQGGVTRSYPTLWIEARIGVADIVGTTITMKEPAWSSVNIKDANNNYAQWTPFPTDIENAYELLDQPGEWYLDRSQDLVYYIPLAGQDMGQVTVIAPVLETLVSGTGQLGTPIHNIQFKGITFAHATWLQPNTNDGLPVGQANNIRITGRPEGFPPGNVAFRTAHAIRFERCIFTHLGGDGLELSGGAQNCLVTGCVFTDISSNGIRIGTVDDPARTDTRKRDTGNQITNCYIHNAPCEYHSGCSIMAGYVDGILISRNEIAYAPYTGISCGWGWGAASYAQGNQFSYNHIHHFNLVMGDGGGIYTLSPQANTKWYGNWFDTMPSRDNGGAIYPDEGSANMEIYNNVCSNIGRYWLYIWTNSIHDISTHDTWTTTSTQRNNGTNCPVSNTTLISGSLGSWPQAAQDIANAAGIQAAYRDIKTMPCACSIDRDTSIVNTPDISPNGGVFADSVAVAMTCATAGATVRYTTDGSDPTAGSALYSGPVVLRTRGVTMVKAQAFKSGLDDSPVATAVFNITPAACRLSSTVWQNAAMEAQGDTFTAAFTAWVSAAPADGIISLSRGPAFDYNQTAAAVRFNPEGRIDARNGAAYSADAVITYTAGTEYRFRLAVDVPTHRYSVYVTPAGGSEVTLAQNCAFRTEQAAVNELTMWNVYAYAGEFTVCDFGVNSAVAIRDAGALGRMLPGGKVRAAEEFLSVTGRKTHSQTPGIYILRTEKGVRKVLVIE